MSSVLKNILAVDKEQELLQSFMRVGITTDDDSAEEALTGSKKDAHRRTSFTLTSSKNHEKEPKLKSGERRKFRKNSDPNGDSEKAADKSGSRGNRIEAELQAVRKRHEEQLQRRKKPRENFVDFYTDKDRAAAVSAGTYDIKQSLQIKQKQDRNEALLIPDEADISSIIALGLKEMKSANPENAIHCFSKALELNNADINALVARSKCYLLLGEAAKALEDAETALSEDKNNIRAIYQKAESLYFLGQFEQSLMFFHRGLRARPELTSFRLGVQKTQEAIENTIGGTTKGPGAGKQKLRPKKKNNSNSGNETAGSAGGETTPKSQQSSSRPTGRPKLTKAELERRNARKLLGELCVDKEYLENLLQHPDLIRADTNTENISTHAKEAVDFLNKRQEFWRQQRPCTALTRHKNLPVEDLPKWF